MTNKISNKKIKDVLYKISKSNLNINDDIQFGNGNTLSGGWITFSSNIKDIGFTKEDINVKYNHEIFSNFMIDFLGELLIRTNTEKFLNEILKFDGQEIVSIVNKDKHKRFGATFDETENKIIFCFHVSLLHNLLTEDFKLHISY